MQNQSFKKTSGFFLLSALLGLGILGLLVLTTATVVYQSNKNIKTNSASQEFSQLKDRVQLILKDENICAEALKQKVTIDDVVSYRKAIFKPDSENYKIRIDQISIDKDSGGQLIFFGDDFQGKHLKIKEGDEISLAALSNLDDENVDGVNYKRYLAELTVPAQQVSIGPGEGFLNFTKKLTMVLLVHPTSHQLFRCRRNGHSSMTPEQYCKFIGGAWDSGTGKCSFGLCSDDSFVSSMNEGGIQCQRFPPKDCTPCPGVGYDCFPNAASAQQTWRVDPVSGEAGWGDCTLVSCRTNYVYSVAGHSCILANQPCDIDAHTKGLRRLISDPPPVYGACQFSYCTPAYPNVPWINGYSYRRSTDRCVPNRIPCTLPNAATAFQSWNASTQSYSACAAETCNTNYKISGTQCIPAATSCYSRVASGGPVCHYQTRSFGKGNSLSTCQKKCGDAMQKCMHWHNGDGGCVCGREHILYPTDCDGCVVYYCY